MDVKTAQGFRETEQTQETRDMKEMQEFQESQSTENVEEVPEILNVIDVIVDDEAMTAYVRIEKPEKEQDPERTYERIIALLDTNKIVYGIKDDIVRRLAERPVYNLKMEVAKGTPAVNGENGEITYLVKRNAEYTPDYNIEGTVDYKNLDYLQLVSKGQVLCEIKKETQGEEGTNIFGKPVPPRPGKPPGNPTGQNTELTEDGSRLIAMADGQVDFVRDKININDLLRIKEHVNMMTGNVNFTGDISIGGDVQSGFAVRSGANIVINGVIESADVEVAGNLNVGKGINGVGTSCIRVGRDLRCRYIENADIRVGGNITADYIINSKIICDGDIILKGAKELIAGGEIHVRGELSAKEIGSESERATIINFIETAAVGDEAEIERLKSENAEYMNNTAVLTETAAKYLRINRKALTPQMREQLDLIKEQVTLLRGRIEANTMKLKELENQMTFEYSGSLSCKKKLYRGVKISFGKQQFRFNSDSLERCRIFCIDGEIIQGTL